MFSSSQSLADRHDRRLARLDQAITDKSNTTVCALAHVPAKWIRFADKDMRQHENLRRFPVILDHRVIQYDREAL
jgi:hypothetical protein